MSVWSGRPRPLPLTLTLPLPLTFVSIRQNIESISDQDTPKM
jgi:hypothetical protein